jgi:hypothetical protein
MENKKFEVGQRWKGADGKEKVIFEIDNVDNIIRVIDVKSGKTDWHSNNAAAQNALVELWQEPRSGFVWVNVHHTEFHEHYEYYSYDSLEAATENAESHLIARIKMPWKEGQFDE